MGKLIVVEGLDGSGKTTQLSLLEKYLESAGITLKKIKLPDYEDPSSTLVRMYLAGDFGKDPKDVNAYTASSFYAVDRAANYIRKWKSDYLNGTLILSDRYTTSNAYHQMQKLDRSEWDEYLQWLEDFEYNKIAVPKPDLVLYLDMPIEVSQKLMSQRYNGDENKKDIHEANVEYLKSCREAALYAAQKLGWRVIECSKNGEALSIETIFEMIKEITESEILD
ncbi:MAG: deoxynucleoside kinase [Clostridia bacterium]|nr:deoxynucleoside kinase [Clostridia bacterium]